MYAHIYSLLIRSRTTVESPSLHVVCRSYAPSALPPSENYRSLALNSKNYRSQNWTPTGVRCSKSAAYKMRAAYMYWALHWCSISLSGQALPCINVCCNFLLIFWLLGLGFPDSASWLLAHDIKELELRKIILQSAPSCWMRPTLYSETTPEAKTRIPIIAVGKTRIFVPLYL